MNHEISRNIPLPIKRQVRQECGFGCVICGLPLYEYDHIFDWSIVKEHKIANLALLCDKHHKEKTNRLLTSDQVLKYRLDPHNLKQEFSKEYSLHFEGTDFSVEIGPTIFSLENVNPTNDFIIPILIDNYRIISFNIVENQLFFDLVVFNKERKLLLEIHENQLIYSIGQWDIEFVGRNLTLREESNKIFFDIDFIIPNKVKINKGTFYYNGRCILIDKNGIQTDRGFFQLGKLTNFRIGFAIGAFDRKYPCGFQLA
ncbi:MAG: HNH endonuclease signature motif containing protein [Cytophaga sp.]|uniref:HNH endonuclease signature motif containing protein n=1 Tax=Cytophaga sp. TaxID=29535 RepID=UPI003F822E1F